jgi:hypothetical protein
MLNLESLCASKSRMAGGPGFEPELPGPEPGVLPLNYPPTAVHITTTIII